MQFACHLRGGWAGTREGRAFRVLSSETGVETGGFSEGIESWTVQIGAQIVQGDAVGGAIPADRVHSQKNLGRRALAA